ncbi:MAG: protoporphyrinogen oxidase [Proteobacteria bacterium]|nr:protoporphyrinogen oxidase [Pseudomonadota bacterium]
MSKKIAVVGGGISGLTAAYRLMNEGCDVSLFEKKEQGGGAIRTGKEEGYLFEYGPNSTMNSNDEIDQLCKLLGLEDERVFGRAVSKKRYVVRYGRPIATPAGLMGFIKSDLWTASGKLRIFKDIFVGRHKGGEESVADYVRRRVGKELLDYGLDPFVSGVYAGDPEKLSLKSTFPKMAALEEEYGSIIRGAIKKGLKGGPKSTRQKGIFSFKEGMDVLPKALTDALAERFRGGTAVEGIKKNKGRYLLTLTGGEYTEADEVILSSPAYINSKIISSLSPEASRLLKGIEYAPLVIVYLGFNRKDVAHPLDGFGCLIPGKEGKKLLGSLWNSSMFPGRVPEGKVCLTNFVGGARNPSIVDRSDKEILSTIMTDLNALFGVKGDPTFIKIIKHKKAIPQYNLGHGKKLDALSRAMDSLPGIHLLGNYLQGVSVADCVKNGVEMAMKVKKRVG